MVWFDITFLPCPGLEIGLYLFSTFRGGQREDLLYGDACNWFDGIHELEDKGTTALQHPYIDIFPPSWVEADFYLLFGPSRVEEGENPVLYLFL